MLWLILVTLTALLLGYWLFIRPAKYWTRRNVSQEMPIPLFGNQGKAFFRQTSFAGAIQDSYKKFPNKRYSGYYQVLSEPALLIRDPKLIKQLGVKDFDYFPDHMASVSDEIEPLWGRNLFALQGQKWRHMRATLSPSFTGSKMKVMFNLMSECAENFIKHFEERVGQGTLSLEMKDVLTRYTNDVIATTAFGIKCDSLENRDNTFYKMGKIISNFSGWITIKFIMAFLVPRLMILLRMTIFDAKVTHFFNNLIKDTIKLREKNKIVRPDMIHLLMEAKKEQKKQDEVPLAEAGFATVQEHIKPVDQNYNELTDMDITAQALIFFLAGFDSVSTLMAFTCYELAIHPEIQERLQQEVDDTYEACNGNISYETLVKMKYLDMVLSESLRKWPNAIAVDRTCVKPYTIQPETPDESPVHLNVGLTIFFPIFSIHRDPQHYADPEKFDPERFNEENKTKINPYIYMPFGVGPRNCIGSRFALLETKLLFFNIMKKFSFVPVEKTEIPIKLSKNQFHLNAENGFWLALKKRVE